jgi:hypothetical protein
MRGKLSRLVIVICIGMLVLFTGGRRWAAGFAGLVLRVLAGAAELKIVLHRF